MPQSLSRVYVHIIFSTKHRKNIISADIKNELFSYLGGICRDLKCNALEVGGHQNHIHVLAILNKSVTQVKLMEEIKKSSSKWIKLKGDKFSNFYWQDGYGIFSVNPSEIDIVREYIQNQEAHHKKKSFKDEFIAFLDKYNVEYDERYLWD
jgi:putative transposase